MCVYVMDLMQQSLKKSAATVENSGYRMLSHLAWQWNNSGFRMLSPMYKSALTVK